MIEQADFLHQDNAANVILDALFAYSKMMYHKQDNQSLDLNCSEYEVKWVHESMHHTLVVIVKLKMGIVMMIWSDPQLILPRVTEYGVNYIYHK